MKQSIRMAIEPDRLFWEFDEYMVGRLYPFDDHGQNLAIIAGQPGGDTFWRIFPQSMFFLVIQGKRTSMPLPDDFLNYIGWQHRPLEGYVESLERAQKLSKNLCVELLGEIKKLVFDDEGKIDPEFHPITQAKITPKITPTVIFFSLFVLCIIPAILVTMFSYY